MAGEALSLSKPILRVYELNGVAYIHHASDCLQIDCCFWAVVMDTVETFAHSTPIYLPYIIAYRLHRWIGRTPSL